METVKFRLISRDAKLPSYAHDGDSGMDISSTESLTLFAGSSDTIHTGLCAKIPDGHELQVRPRSGLAKKGVVASFGTVDCGYRGEIMVTLFNHSNRDHFIEAGDRIAQLVLSPVKRAEIVESDRDFGETERGVGGFGSTGV